MGLFKKKKKVEIDPKELQRQLVDEERGFIEENLPQEREQITEVVRNLSNELMEYKGRYEVLQKELAQAVKRKKVKRDPMLGKYALVLFSLPKVKRSGQQPKIRMHTVDNVHGNQALQSIRNLMRDPDNEFVGAYVLLEMRGKSDGYARLEKNAEGAWHLFQCLDGDLKKYAPGDDGEKPEDPDEENPYKETDNKTNA